MKYTVIKIFIALFMFMVGILSLVVSIGIPIFLCWALYMLMIHFGVL